MPAVVQNESFMSSLGRDCFLGVILPSKISTACFEDKREHGCKQFQSCTFSVCLWLGQIATAALSIHRHSLRDCFAERGRCDENGVPRPGRLPITHLRRKCRCWHARLACRPPPRTLGVVRASRTGEVMGSYATSQVTFGPSLPAGEEERSVIMEITIGRRDVAMVSMFVVPAGALPASRAGTLVRRDR